MQFVTRYLPPFFMSWLLAFTFASLLHSHYVVNQLVNVGVIVMLSDRLSLTVDDWIGLLPTYGSIIAIAFIIAFSVAGKVIQSLNGARTLVFVLAGILAFTVVLLAIESIMNINIIAGARGWGFYAQLTAGAVGGFVFSKLSKPNSQNPYVFE